MIIDLNKLNSLEQEIYNTLINYAKEHSDLRITEAASICGCSTSKISKFVKKLGFATFKQFASFIEGKEIPTKKYSSELKRIRDFTNLFDSSLVDKFISMLKNHKKIILFGYGPSYHCAQYFEYKLRLQTDAVVIAVSDVGTAQTLIDNTTLLVILSTTGHFASFKTLYEDAKEKNCTTLLLVEEYHPDLLDCYNNICFLTNTTQSSELKPHEKSRIVFFIFIEEVIFKLIKQKNEALQ